MKNNSLLQPITVTLSAIVMVVGTLAGFGLIGTRVEDSAEGAFSADATLLTPDSPAFSIWSLIYILLGAYVVWQWVNYRSAVATRIGWLAAASMVLNAMWLGATQVGWIWPSVVIILVLAIVLGMIVDRLGTDGNSADTPVLLSQRASGSQLGSAATSTRGSHASPGSGSRLDSAATSTRESHSSRGSGSRSWIRVIVLDLTFGIYLGWVSVASVPNVAIALIDAGIDPGDPWAEVVAIIVLAVAAGLGVMFAFRLGGRWSVSLAMSWALAWIAVGRLMGPLFSTSVAVAAIAAALVILAANAYYALGSGKKNGSGKKA